MFPFSWNESKHCDEEQREKVLEIKNKIKEIIISKEKIAENRHKIKFGEEYLYRRILSRENCLKIKKVVTLVYFMSAKI